MPRRSAVRPSAVRPSAATPLLRELSRELARVGGLLSPDYLASGMSLCEARCLYELGHADGLEISALAGRLDLDLGYVSRTVSRLVTRGLASKRVAEQDARARSVVVTAKGARQLAALELRANRRLDAWLAAVPKPAADRLVGGLEALYGAAGGAAGRDIAARIAIRAPRPGELGHIIARHGEIYSELGYPPVFERYVVQAFGEFTAELAPPRDRIFVAERAGRFAGAIASKGLPDATAQLRFLIVEPEARGAGLGRRLVRRVIDHARRSGDRRVVLDTASDLAPARALYSSFGFMLVTSTHGESWLRRGVASERWELML
jgi:DNA-binding MarR family transcriptional regulator/RimJ/RimL family protein N-acetyltransferase